MGQRLNLEIVSNDTCLANAYYHWGGYTSSSLELTVKALTKYNSEIRRTDEFFINAIEMLLSTGAAFTDDEKKVYDAIKFINCFGQEIVKKEIKSNGVAHRNDGLISLSSYGIFTTRRWEDARVQIDISNKQIKFEAAWKLDEDDLSDIKDINGITKLDFDLNAIPFESFQTFRMFLDDLIKKEIYNFKDINDAVWSMIE
ncbi:MAG: hypothetical protein ACK5L6_03855 [Anaerorhabdus sp.]|uniref:hypothetical protein n=1 Tax=Anaerorhabdus sp. TaxID=1872524 RepID=UPI003A852BAA